MSYNWAHDKMIREYITLAYDGTESASRGRRRVFVWEDDEGTWIGNAEAFTIHLGELFDLDLSTTHAWRIHAILREEGLYAINPPAHRCEPDRVNGKKFTPPRPMKRKYDYRKA